MLKAISSVSTVLLMIAMMTLISNKAAMADSASSSSSSSAVTPTGTKTVTAQATSTSPTPSQTDSKMLTTTTVVDGTGKSITTIGGIVVPIGQVTIPTTIIVPTITISN